ncbi:hypothetical protein QUV83_15335 [Cellulomonas cellasea]|uniref:hypothetical protein n=1 Tax=Cellulomonas cellasea TaxID=43670 RepID=UPI0025A374D8|nr:hypothetical protein [Cellulomonas cellasea]MDM8086145.1 hypothetical protein [Cellulomonas cellasea]
MAMLASALVQAATTRTGHACEEGSGLLHEPVSTVTSLAFVVAGGLILAGGRRARQAAPEGPAAPVPTAAPHRTGTPPDPTGSPQAARQRSTAAYAALVASIGVGSVVQHGPDPAWSDVAHDLPLLATLAFVAADSVADLTGRRRAWWWWAAPSVALVPLIAAAPVSGDVAQGVAATAAVGLTLARAVAVPRRRARIAWSIGLLGVGGVIGVLTRAGGPWCAPGSLWQGHGAWHLLAATALVVLAPVIGDREPPGTGQRRAAPSSTRDAA